MTSSDVITWAPVKRAGVITNFPSSKDAPEIPACLSVGLALHSLVSKVLLPDSHSFFLLLFFIHQIAFHFPPLLGPPLSVTPNPPFSFSLSIFLPPSLFLMSLCHFLPAFFLLCLHRSPPPAAILELREGGGGGGGERDSLTW